MGAGGFSYGSHYEEFVEKDWRIKMDTKRSDTSKQCSPIHKDGPYCCEPKNHQGPHKYKCAGSSCPGLSWPASLFSHPVACTLVCKEASD